MNLLTYLTLVSGISFLIFGVASFTTSQMKSEFIRYGLKNSRKLAGSLQLLGATGLLFGLIFSPLLMAISALGLSILMLIGFLVRIKIRDSLLQSAPSLSYALLNAIILIMACNRVLNSNEISL